MPTRILYIDVEAGWGGSSRSLMHMIDSLDPAKWRPAVVMRKTGPIIDQYNEKGIPYIVVPELPSFRPAERKNIVTLGIHLWRRRHFGKAVAKIRAFAHEHDCKLIHVNHESMALSGSRIARLLGLPWVCHIRTQLHDSAYSRALARMIAKRAKHRFYISEPVEEHFQNLARGTAGRIPGTVVYNICHAPDPDADVPDVMANSDARLKVISLSSFSPNRGVDRIIDVAAVLRDRNIDDIQFFMFGLPAHVNPLTGKPVPFYENMLAKIRDDHLSGIVHMPGQLPRPDGALLAGDALIKLTRHQNPWGRDIMEGMAAGLSIVTLGRYDKFVEPEKNGYLSAEFSPEDIADYLIRLRDDAALRANIRATNKAKAKELFGSGRMAAALDARYSAVLTDSIQSA